MTTESKQSQSGRFFVIEGSEASGKYTQLQILAERLAKAGYDVVTFDFPQYQRESSYFVRQYLSGAYGTAEQVGPYTASVFYALDRYAAKDAIHEALAAGKIVLANRFVGSNMAHQGTRFSHPEERRGFFVWLDNLEYQMFQIPRPTKSYVLRVDPKTIAALLQKRAKEQPERKTDILEADMTHIERSVEVYDDLCTLFPKDFIRIDCVRSGQLLDPQYINEILWQLVEQELMPKTKTTGTLENASQKTADDKTTAPRVLKKTHTAKISAMAFSTLYAQNLTQKVNISYNFDHFDKIGVQGAYNFFIPAALDPKTRQIYQEGMNALCSNYAAMVRHLTAVLEKSHSNSSDISPREIAIQSLRAALPLSVLFDIDIDTEDTQLADTATSLLVSELSELQELGQSLFREARESINVSLKGRLDTVISNMPLTKIAAYQKNMQTLTDQMLPSTHAHGESEVTLTHYWPRNEMDLIPDILYQYSNLSLRDIAHAIRSWTYDEKEIVMKEYMTGWQSGAVRNAMIEVTRFDWEVLCETDTALELLANASPHALTLQSIVPRYGYKMSKTIMDADLSELFEENFDLSIKLHDSLLSAGYESEARYTVLFGHKNRWKFTLSGSSLMQISKRKEQFSEETRTLIRLLLQTAAEKYPLLFQYDDTHR